MYIYMYIDTASQENQKVALSALRLRAVCTMPTLLRVRYSWVSPYLEYLGLTRVRYLDRYIDT